MNLKFDWTINVPVLIAAATLLIGVFKSWLQQRDFNRNLEVILGRRAPRDDRSGVLGDIAELQDRTDLHEEIIESHRQQLGIERRRAPRRTS